MKRGFTLIELLAVLLILTFLVAIIVPVVSNILASAHERMYEVKIANIEAATEIWAVDNTDLLPENEGESIIINLRDLKEGGYVEEDLKNPLTRELFPNNLTIEIKLERNSYRYIVEE